MWSADELIVAPATVRAGAGRAVVRLAGRGLSSLLHRLFEPCKDGFPTVSGAGRLVPSRLQDAALVAGFGPLAIDVLFWPGPSGPIGGPLAELQLPGSVPLVDAVVARSIELGARLARGGEFSLRAFLAGRIDLLQAEAVLAVVESHSPSQLSAALDRMAGGVGRELEAARQTLLDLAGDIEAMIDFGEEALGEEAMLRHRASLAARLCGVDADLCSLADRLGSRGAGGTERPRVVIAGRPNIGKSSLFNLLVGHAAAIVADEPGTTRDWVEARIGIRGIECVMVDVAGIDPAADGAEPTAVAMQQITSADVLVSCVDAADGGVDAALPPHSRRIDVVTRCDRGGRPASTALEAIVTSTVDGTGIATLKEAIADAVAAATMGATFATLRLAEGISLARGAVGRAASVLSGAEGAVPFDEAVLASHVGLAVAALGEVTGMQVGDDILDRIFSRHCIGK